MSFIAYEVDELLKVFQINLAKDTEGYRKLARASLKLASKLTLQLARHKGEPVATPLLVDPGDQGAIAGGTLGEALDGWKKERSPSSGVLAEYERAIRLFRELHGDLPVVQIKRQHARSFREARARLARAIGPQACFVRRFLS